MGMLADALKPPSAYRMKKDNPGFWPDLISQIDGAQCDADLKALEVWIDLRPNDMPDGWAQDALERIEARREELKQEDLGYILRDRFDF